MMGDDRRSMAVDIRTEPFELTRDVWCREILAKLRPPGRYIIEVQVPLAAAADENAKRTMGHIEDAQRAFDEGRWAEVARVCYRALEDIQGVIGKVELRYGTYTRDRIRDQIKDMRALCNPDRHGETPVHDGLSFDRVLAPHALATTSSIAGVVLR